MSNSRRSVSPTTTTSAVATALRNLSKPEEKLTAEEMLRQKKENGKKKFGRYMAQRTRMSKKADLFAEIDFGNEEELNTFLADKEVQAYLRENPDFQPGLIFAIEHNAGIGEIVKGKQTAPAILTLSNLPMTKLNLSKYGIDLDQLLKKYDLATIKLGRNLILDGLTTSEDSPILSFHLTSGPDAAKKATRKKEVALIQEIMKALLLKHQVVYSGGDGQDNLVKMSKDGKSPAIQDGHMVLNEDLRDVLDGFDGVTLETVKFSDVKIKQRGYREEGEFQGPSPVSNQWDKFKPDSASKLVSEVVRKKQDDDKPNSQLLDRYPLPLKGTEEYLATSEEVADHRPVVDKSEKMTRIFSGGVSQEGPKAFKDPKKLFKPEAFEFDADGNAIVKPEVLKAGAAYCKKWTKLLVANCAQVKLANPTEKPEVDSKAIREPKTSLGYLEAFYNALSAVDINPFKSSDEIIAQVDFNNTDQVASLTAALEKMNMPPITTPEEMKTILDSQDVNARRVCLALRDAGVQPFKTEEEMMSTFNFQDEDKMTLLAEAINKLLQVQAVEPGEEKKAAFSVELRMAFKKSAVALLKSDEFDQGYHAYANEEHVKSHGHIRRGPAVSDDMFEAQADNLLEYANARTDNGSRSPLNRFSQTAFDGELSGGFVIVAGKTPTTEDMRVELCIENARLVAENRFSDKNVFLSVTETSTKGLGKVSKKQSVGNLYADTAMEYQFFLKDSQVAVLRQAEQQQATKDATASLSSPESTPKIYGNGYQPGMYSSALGFRRDARDVSRVYLETRATMGR